jgi:hypothetical protein
MYKGKGGRRIRLKRYYLYDYCFVIVLHMYVLEKYALL